MSLCRLLTAGKALTSLRDEPSSYQMRRKALLPKFGSSGDPFTSAKASPPPVGEIKPATPPAAHKNSWSLVGWWKRFTPKPKIGCELRPQPTRLAGKTNGRVATPVQAELSLDNVKVVRNTLHEADVTLVARGGAPPAGLLLGAVAAQRAEHALDRLAERIVGVERR